MRSVSEPKSALCCAATHSSPSALNTLVEFGASLDPEAIFHAIGGFRYEANGTATLEALIEMGADVNGVAARWGTPVAHAVRCEEKEKVRVLMENGADPEKEFRRMRSGKTGWWWENGTSSAVEVARGKGEEWVEILKGKEKGEG